MNTHCKSLHPDDYAALSGYVERFEQMARRVPASIEHHHRRWETAIALAAIDEIASGRGGTLLEIGSGGSLFAPLAASLDYDVTVVDPDNRVRYAIEQGRKIDRDIRVVQASFLGNDLGTFDYVACLSVIEHVEDDAAFWRKALASANKGVVLTTDFSLTGETFGPDHLRTYAPDDLRALSFQPGWTPLGRLDYADNGAHVYGYSFASLCLERI